MKQVLRTFHCATAILFTGQEPSLPLNFQPTSGMFLWRPEHHVVMIWDGSEFMPLNLAGWASKYLAQFPMNIKVGHWAVVAPIPLAARPSARAEMFLDHDMLRWAFRVILPAVSESDMAVSDQLGETGELTLTE